MTSQTDRRNGITGNLGIKAPVRCATTANITLSGLQTVDGTVLVADDRVLVKNQTDATENGVYNASSSAWQRALDFDGVNDVVSGTLVGITNGTTHANQIWQLVATNPITFDTTALTFVYILTTNSSSNLATIANLASVANLATIANLASVANLSTAAVGKGADIASAATVNLTTATGEYLDITGTTTITAITLTSGSQRLVRFTGILTLTHGANLVLPSAANITTAAGDFALFVGDASSVVRCVGYFRANGTPIVAGNQATESVAGISKLPKQITIANNVSDANNDIDFSAGNFQFSDGTGIASLSALTKRLDASWAVGTNQGGLFSGAKANSTWYHCFAIYNPTTGISDCGFDTSVSAANIPSGYTKYYLIESIKTNSSGNILGFYHYTNNSNSSIVWNVPVLDIYAVSTSSATLRTLSTPLGRMVLASIKYTLTDNVSSGTFGVVGLITSPKQSDIDPNSVSNANFSRNPSYINENPYSGTIYTDTLSRVRTRESASGYTITNIYTNGWRT